MRPPAFLAATQHKLQLAADAHTVEQGYAARGFGIALDGRQKRQPHPPARALGHEHRFHGSDLNPVVRHERNQYGRETDQAPAVINPDALQQAGIFHARVELHLRVDRDQAFTPILCEQLVRIRGPEDVRGLDQPDLDHGAIIGWAFSITGYSAPKSPRRSGGSYSRPALSGDHTALMY